MPPLATRQPARPAREPRKDAAQVGVRKTQGRVLVGSRRSTRGTDGFVTDRPDETRTAGSGRALHFRARADRAAGQTQGANPSVVNATSPSGLVVRFDEFVDRAPAERSSVLARAIAEAHGRHFQANAAYRACVAARGVGERVEPQHFARLLRPASLTFKSYVDVTGPFPQDCPALFVGWLQDHLSVPLPFCAAALASRYKTFEGLLGAIETALTTHGIEIVTSSGTSGRASVVVRDGPTLKLAVEAFFAGITRAWGIRPGTALIFLMPERTRVAMARTAVLGTRTTDWASRGRVYFTMPFTATPDQLRIRAGRAFRSGMAGAIERRVWHPFMVWAGEHLAPRRFVPLTRRRLEEVARRGAPLMLLGALPHLHAVAREGPLVLPPGSRVASGGGTKERYPFTPAQIRRDLAAAFPGAVVCDVYGMAEANWAAFECAAGNHHIPPWVYAVVTDDDDQIVMGPDTTGLLAFFDPIGGGGLFPPFFQTADRVRLVNGSTAHDPARSCPCGDDSAYILGEIARVDLTEEAGCAAQV